MAKLGLIAGGGALPVVLAEQCRLAGRPLFVLRLKGMADPALDAYPGAEAALGQMGRWLGLLHDAGCEAVCMAGRVARPDFSTLKLDLRALKALPRVLAAAGQGDDALLRFFVDEFEREGFVVEGAHQVAEGLAAPEGVLGRIAPGPADREDMFKGFAVAGEIGRLDIGQAVVVRRGLVLAVEAQEGTDAMLARCAGLPEALRGPPGERSGVLVKRSKPIQEERVDLPTLGVATVEGAARAGLAGVAGEAGRTLVVDRAAVIAAADALGLFVFGLPAGG